MLNVARSIQCNGYTDGGVVGSKPAPIFANPVPAGSQVQLNWTTWPDSYVIMLSVSRNRIILTVRVSHKGPIITYLARAPSDITQWQPGTE